MVVNATSSPFGGQTRTRALVALRLIGDSYPRELARVLVAPLSSVQKAVRSLEKDGLVAGRTMGRTRVVRLNPRYFAAEALRAFLLRLTEPEVELKDRISAIRKRPRPTGKPLRSQPSVPNRSPSPRRSEMPSGATGSELKRARSGDSGLP
jgi:hypothetical protein